MESIRIRTRGLTFAAHVHGAGERVALLLHGFPDSPASFAPMAARLAAEGYRCVVPWARGPGPTGRAPDDDYSVHRLAHDVIDLLDALDATAPLVVGHDWGAVAATAAAALAPDRFGHLVAMSVPPIPSLVRELVRNPAQRRRSLYLARFQLPWLPELDATATRAFVRRYWRTWSPGLDDPRPWADPVARAVVGRSRRRAWFGPYRALVPRPGHVDAWRRSLALVRQRVRVPTLFVVGADDGCIGPDAFADADRHVDAPCVVRRIPNAGHFVTVERPERVVREIVDFTGRTEAYRG